jgi:hypothetical protein
MEGEPRVGGGFQRQVDRIVLVTRDHEPVLMHAGDAAARGREVIELPGRVEDFVRREGRIRDVVVDHLGR